jgi:hypothetical protein
VNLDVGLYSSVACRRVGSRAALLLLLPWRMATAAVPQAVHSGDEKEAAAAADRGEFVNRTSAWMSTRVEVAHTLQMEVSRPDESEVLKGEVSQTRDTDSRDASVAPPSSSAC